MISRPTIGLLCAIVATAFTFFAMTGSAAAAGSIEGEVVDAVTEIGIGEAVVCAYEFQAEVEACEETDADGEYVLSGLADGDYVVEFWAADQGYVTQLYDGASKPADADKVTVSGGTALGVDAKMAKGGGIEGRVTDVATGAGIGAAEVCAFSLSAFGACTITDSSGDYTLSGLATGVYLVEFWAGLLGYETLFYDQETDPDEANPVSVTAPDATTGIDARLSKPGSGLVLPTLPSVPGLSVPQVIRHPKPKPKAIKCRKGFKRVKRHGRKVCVKKHKKKKKHRS